MQNIVLKEEIQFMIAMHHGIDYEYYPIEMYKTGDCTGEALVNGLERKDGVMSSTEMIGNKPDMRDDEWGDQVLSFKLHKDLTFYTWSDWDFYQGLRGYIEF